MSMDALAWAFRQGLPCAEKLILIMLADSADMDDYVALADDELAEMCGLPIAAARAERMSLVAMGFIEESGVGTVGNYRLRRNR